MTWDGTERRNVHRRHDGDAPVTNNDLDEALAVHSLEERRYIDAVVANVLKAFPNEDVAGHREYHDRKIKAAIAEEEFWRTAKQEMIKAGVNGMLKVLWLALCLAALGLTVKFTMPDVFARTILGVMGK
jgi:hypothetical protein